MAIYKSYSRFLNNSEIYTDSRDGIDKVFYKHPNIQPDVTDVIFTIPAGSEFRPDLISLSFYNSPSLVWVLMLVNEFDHIKEFYTGRNIRVPKFDRIRGKFL